MCASTTKNASSRGIREVTTATATSRTPIIPRRCSRSGAAPANNGAGDALELELPDPDLSDYDRHLDEETEQ